MFQAKGRAAIYRLTWKSPSRSTNTKRRVLRGLFDQSLSLQETSDTSGRTIRKRYRQLETLEERDKGPLNDRGDIREGFKVLTDKPSI